MRVFSSLLVSLFFFFQAEDGIRDTSVTGVQTCALPISALAPTPFTPDPFHTALGTGFSPTGISVPIQNAFNPFTVPDTFTPADSPQPGIPVTTGVKYRSLEAGNRKIGRAHV